MPLQLHQNLNLLLLLILGSLTANISMSWLNIGFILLFTLILEHFFLYFNKSRSFYFSYSALSTAIGIVVLMYSTSLWIYLLVISLALAQKHFLNFQNRHLFNPSNFALIMALLLFYNDAHMISGQLGDEPLFAMVVFVLAMSILVRVQRWIIPIVFVFFYLTLQYFFIVQYDPVVFFEEVYHRFYSIGFMLFIYFMLTDPVVTPSTWQGQTLFAFLVAFLIALLDRFYGFRVQHLFMSVFLFSFFVNLLPLKMLSISQLKLAMIILLFSISTLVYIELQPPYYFEMNG